MVEKKNKKKGVATGFILGGLAVIFIGLVGFVSFAERKNGEVEKFIDGVRPEKIKISNITERSFNVSFVTKRKVNGSVLIEGREIKDDRDKYKKTIDGYYVHFVTVGDLKAAKEYSFRIKSGSESYGKNGEDFLVKTKKEEEKTECEMKLAGNVAGAGEDVVVYVSVDEINLAYLVDDKGHFGVNFGKEGVCPTFDEEMSVFFEGGDRGNYLAKIVLREENKLNNIVLE